MRPLLLSLAIATVSLAALAEDNASTKAFEASMDKMHHGMMIPYTGNTDNDFVTGMIPHHQGAVDMAEIELKYGKDPEIRKLAKGIISAQKKEIAFMQAWLAKHPSETGAK